MSVADWKFEEFVAKNDKKMSNLDFIYLVTKTIALPQDFFLCVGRLFSPRIVRFEGILVMADWFDEDGYREYRENGMTSNRARAWTNMVELTDVFQGITYDHAKQLAVLVAGSWDNAIQHQFPDEAVRANVLLEEASDEVYVTLGEFSD